MNKTALILAALLLAACARQSDEPPLGRQLAGLSSAQRDAEGRKAAQMLRRANRDDDPDVAVRDIRYRAADDTFVYTVVLKRLKNTHGITPAARRRAQAVQTALTQRGIDISRITAQGYGKDYPVANNATAEGRAMNRRVEVIIADDKGNLRGRNQ